MRLRDAERQGAAALDAAKAELQAARSEFLTVEAVQKAALGKGQAGTSEWLARQQARRAARGSRSSSRSTRAGSARSRRRSAATSKRFASTASMRSRESMESLGAGPAHDCRSRRSSGSAKPDAGSLAARVAGPAVVADLLAGVIAVESLAMRWRAASRCRPGQSVITRNGIWLGRDWVRVARSEAGHAGVIAREQELKALHKAVAGQEARVAELEGRARRDARAARGARCEPRRAAREGEPLHHDLVNVRGAHEAIRSKAQQIAERVARLIEEMAQVDADISRDEADAGGCRSRLDGGARAASASLQHARPGARARARCAAARRSRLRASSMPRTTPRPSRWRSASSPSARRSRRLRTSLERASDHVAPAAKRGAPTSSASSPRAKRRYAELERQLQAFLEQRLAVERELGDARRAVEDADAQRARAGRGAAEGGRRVAESARAALAEISLGMQETRVRRESLVEQFAATQFDLEQVTAALPEDATVVAWDQQLVEVTERIERLGAVNLASIDELKEQSERKEYLDRQFADLSDALNTLEQAIRKIDRETRARFQDTFDRINSGLKDKFPRLFGGGAAYLELVGDDLLSAGVAVMARPPGKRNSTIHQLSGGEKALTAVALVFSIFELNPAPFCLLDEVDAPLDDHNVGRFCDIVRDMSERVQFVFITHNKNTMELASHLIGVTMGEPGVSRLVAVDVDEAVRMAAVG